MGNPFEIILERLNQIEKAIKRIAIILQVPQSATSMNLIQVAAYLNIAPPAI